MRSSSIVNSGLGGGEGVIRVRGGGVSRLSSSNDGRLLVDDGENVITWSLWSQAWYFSVDELANDIAESGILARLTSNNGLTLAL